MTFATIRHFPAHPQLCTHTRQAYEFHKQIYFASLHRNEKSNYETLDYVLFRRRNQNHPFQGMMNCDFLLPMSAVSLLPRHRFSTSCKFSFVAPRSSTIFIKVIALNFSD